ncbi:hypothetical protein RZS08_33120, partial [Arthrospira platensis SPKY1]|nr:hypothetical protein [Arthrospira platensis SPKY1]
RKGDTALVRINDELFSCWQFKKSQDGSCKVSVDKIKSPQEAWASHFETSDYYHVLKKIFLELGERNFSVIVISDGYETSFKRIRNAADVLDLKLNDIEYAEAFYKAEYDVFFTHSNVSC